MIFLQIILLHLHLLFLTSDEFSASPMEIKSEAISFDNHDVFFLERKKQEGSKKLYTECESEIVTSYTFDMKSSGSNNRLLEYIRRSPLVQKTSFLFTRQHVLLLREGHVSLEHLEPHPEDCTRKTSLIVAVMNLVATVCGGGVLSLPLVFAKAGIVPTTLLMLYGCYSTERTLYFLVDSARWMGGRSYGDVANAAFGSSAQVLTTLSLAIMLCGSLIAYQVLVKDVWSPVLFHLFPQIHSMLLQLGHTEKNAKALLLGLILLAAFPLLIQKDLHALRHTCYVGFSSCVLLMIAIVYRAMQQLSISTDSDTVEHSIKWWSSNPADWLFAFPIVALCFFCSYNVLGVHSQLVRPTRERVGFVLRTSMVICLVLFYLVGLGGYIFAGNQTRDNILLNFEISDRAVLSGRIGFCLTLMFGLPLILLPCREAALAVPMQWSNWRKDDEMISKFQLLERDREEGAHLVVNGVDFDNDEPILLSKDPQRRHGALLTYGAVEEGTLATTELSSESLPLLGLETRRVDDVFAPENITATFAILLLTYSVAVSVPGVASVWSIFGSSMAIWIAFVVPCGCYLKIREHKGLTVEALGAWILLIISTVAMIICTRQAIISVMVGGP